MRPILSFATAAVLSLVPAAAAAASPAGALGLEPWTPVLLALAGLLLLCIELFVVPGFGVAGILGLIAVLAGVVLAVIGPFPGTGDVAVALAAVVSSFTLIAVAAWGAGTRLRAGHPLLGGILRRDEGYVASLPRPELEGVEGVALTDLRPAGTARFGDELLDVVSEAGWIAAGTPVRVLRAEGYRHVVTAEPLPPGEPEGPAEEPSAE